MVTGGVGPGKRVKYYDALSHFVLILTKSETKHLLKNTGLVIAENLSLPINDLLTPASISTSKKLTLPYGKYVFGAVSVYVTRFQDNRGVKLLVHRVRKLLGFQAERCSEIVRHAAFQRIRAFEKIAAIEL